jgi:SAM-dependent methyltransferase
LFKAVCGVLRERDGADFEDVDCHSIEEAVVVGSVRLEDSMAAMFISATSDYLHRRAGAPLISFEKFESRVNEILAAEDCIHRLVQGKWLTTGKTEADVLRRVLLRGDDELAGCRQGDQQVEMVVSTIQARLTKPGAILVDYGAGLGRVLAGLAGAQRFRSASYVAVDEPVPEEVRSLAETTGAAAQFVSRTDFLARPVDADVIMIVNTLHHIPFPEIALQMEPLFAALKPGGILLVHEMGALGDPEQRNVPWQVEDLIALFLGPCFVVNPRSTTSRTGVPLAHVLVEKGESATGIRQALSANAKTVWKQMKRRTLNEIRELYAERDERRSVALQHALIVNANLDLNRPSDA